jgi:hypothetical protein
MSRRSTTGYGHRVTEFFQGQYVISWTWDAHYPSSRLRFPRHMSKVTDRKGAERFCKKWGCKMPPSTPERTTP